MAIRDFYLKIDEDTVFFRRVNTSALEESEVENADRRWIDALSASPKVIDISHLTYSPQVDSEWNGVDFVHASGVSTVPFDVDLPFANPKRFAFLVDNKYKLSYIVEDNINNEGIIAALSSDPVIIMEDKE